VSSLSESESAREERGRFLGLGGFEIAVGVGFGLEADRDTEKRLGGPVEGGDMEVSVVRLAEGMMGGLYNRCSGLHTTMELKLCHSWYYANPSGCLQIDHTALR